MSSITHLPTSLTTSLYNMTEVDAKPPLTAQTTYAEIQHPVINEAVPSDKINLRFLLVDGRRTDLIVDPSNTAEEIQQKAFDTWPKGKSSICDVKKSG